MEFLVTTPESVIVKAEDVRYVRADDETGSFGIQPGHADFLTVLTVSVVTWRDQHEREHHVAVRGGLLTVRGGNRVEIATREAVDEDTLSQLGSAVLEKFRKKQLDEEASRVSSKRLHLAAIRQIQSVLDSRHHPNPQGLPPSLGPSEKITRSPTKGAGS